MTAGEAIWLGVALGVFGLIVFAMVLLAAAENGWRNVGKWFLCAAIILAFPVVGAVISYTIVIGW